VVLARVSSFWSKRRAARDRPSFHRVGQCRPSACARCGDIRRAQNLIHFGADVSDRVALAKLTRRQGVCVLTGVDHVTLAVRELEPAVQAYQRLLGSEPSWRGAHPDLGTEGALFALSNAAIELVAPAAGAAESEGLRARLDAHGEGLIALAFCVADAGAWSQALRARGLRATAPQEGEATSRAGTRRHYRSVDLSPRATRGLALLGVERAELSELRAPAPPAAACVDALDHVVIRTADPEAAIALYQQGLDIRLALDRTFGSTRMLFFRTGAVTLELVHDPTAGASDAFHGLAFRVRDIDGAHARLRAAGVATGAVRDGNKAGTRVFSATSGTCNVPTLFLRDPARD
jgi:catechol 2,3-dioxygenase-like lactoylglutathione lyase family enzyme